MQEQNRHKNKIRARQHHGNINSFLTKTAQTTTCAFICTNWYLNLMQTLFIVSIVL